MRVIVEKIEENMLVLELESGKTINVSHELIPLAQENDVIDITINSPETLNRKNKANELMNKLFK